MSPFFTLTLIPQIQKLCTPRHRYAVLKQRVCEAACVLDSESYDSIVRANGVATIEVN